jgi:hypothetical protein
MSSTIARRVALVVALVALGTPVFTQQAGSQEGGELNPWAVPGWSFVPGLTLSGVYDTNVALASAPADTQRTQGDRLYIAEPFGQLRYFGRRTNFSTGYGGYLRRYSDFDQLNGFDQRGYLTLRHLATRHVTLFLHDTYMDVPSTDEVELNGIPFSRTGSRFNTLAAGVEARLTKFTDLSVRYDQTWVTFDRKDTLLTGGWVNGVKTELARRLTDRASLGAEYGIRLADLNEGTRQVVFQDAGGTLRYAAGPHTSLSLGAGVSHLVDDARDESRTGPYFRAGVTHDGERATIGAGYERMFVPSFGFGGSNQSQELRAFVQMPLDRNRTYVQGSAAWRRSDPFIPGELKLDTIWLRSTVGYALARWLRLEGFYAFTRQDSQVTGGEIHRHRTGVQIVISQPVRIR